MGVSSDISSLFDDLGKREMTPSEVRNRLTAIKDQADAQEAELQGIRTTVERQEKELTKLHLEVHKQEQAPKGWQPGDGEKKVLKSISVRENQGKTTFFVKEIASELGMEISTARHHFDVLFDAGAIDWINPGFECVLQPLGRTYIHRHVS
jgi:DNA-binding transcriptional ArsR family regulator